MSRWGAQGGTYPGAVVPHGMVQVTPETRHSAGGRGYYYQDSTIHCFSFLDHLSGFPEGSAGIFKMMPVCDISISSTFHHNHEMAQPGFYSVLLSSGIRFECTATAHSGFCRIAFPETNRTLLVFHDISQICSQKDMSITGRCDHYYFKIEFDHAITTIQRNGKQVVVRFHECKNRTLLCKAGFSTRSLADAAANLTAEIPDWRFDAVRRQTGNKWHDLLGRINIKGGSEQQKITFYTALYHSFLLPMLISDVNESAPRYAGFSPWDTYQTVHPLLTLLQPKEHGEMLASLVQESVRHGRFPNFPMAGNHIIPVLADAWVKGTRTFDLDNAYTLVHNIVYGSAADMTGYERYGFVAADQANSVSKTLAFAYDDWAASILARYANRTADHIHLLKRSMNYRNHFNPETRLMSAKSADGDWIDHVGFEEGDAWDYSWMAPHNMQDLINLMGGVEAFAEHLESHFKSGRYLHDNEPSLHYAYLFNYAGMPWKTQKWVRHIIDTKYSPLPGGLPGNDDLGSLSSWYVFSALGFYPVCPGRAQYVFASPLFDEVLITLQNGKRLSIQATRAHARDMYIKSMTWNGKPYAKTWLEHADLVQGGTLCFTMISRPDTSVEIGDSYLPPSLTRGNCFFEILSLTPDTSSMLAGDSLTLNVQVRNKGEKGSKEFRLYMDNHIHSSRWIMLDQNESCSIKWPVVLYESGTHTLTLTGTPITVQVEESPATFKIENTSCTPIARFGTPVTLEATAVNVGGHQGETRLAIFVNDRIVDSMRVLVMPGEKKRIKRSLSLAAGLHTIRINDSAVHMVKVYQQNLDAEVLHLTFDQGQGIEIPDFSGFSHHAQSCGPVQWIEGKINGAISLSRDSYIELPQAAALNLFDKTITMSIWLYPLDDSPADFFSKGDYNVLKTEAGANGLPMLSFFAGGWGRGEAKHQLQAPWAHRWHHIAGVCDGAALWLYLDGNVVAQTAITGDIEANPFPWLIGRNAEKPGERKFLGYVDEVRMFREALDKEEIKSLYRVD